MGDSLTPAEPVRQGAPAASRAGPRVLNCPHCGGTVKIRASGISITVVCDSCGSVLDVANPDVRLLAEAQTRTRQPPIPIGTRGTLVGAVWEVIGYQNRSNIQEGWTWDEYLLFNPYLGFRFLAQDDDDWVLYCMLRDDVTDPEAGFQGHTYELRDSGEARTNYVLGEFYWRVREGDNASVAEYESGAYLLSREQNDAEIVWSRGVRLSDDDVQSAFKMQSATSAQTASATTAAAPTAGSLRRGVLWVGAIAIAALFLLHMISFGTSHSVTVFSRQFHTTAADKGRTLTSDPFTIPGKGGNLQVTTSSPVRNNWVELNLTLVGPNNITFYDAPSIEYYYGEDSDGSWSEGSQSTSSSFVAVPGGSYRLLIEPYAGAYDTDLARATPAPTASLFPALQGQQPPPQPVYRNPVDFTVTVTRHVPSWWNFLFALLLLLPYPIYRIFSGGGSSKHPPLKPPAKVSK